MTEEEYLEIYKKVTDKLLNSEVMESVMMDISLFGTSVMEIYHGEDGVVRFSNVTAEHRVPIRESFKMKEEDG